MVAIIVYSLKIMMEYVGVRELPDNQWRVYLS